MTALDDTFRANRTQLRDKVVAQASAVWQTQHTDRNRYLAQVLTAVEGGQRAMVTLTSAYLTAKAREVGHVRFQALNAADYTVAKLRDTPAVEVYARPYGALYGQLNGGADEATAQASALDAVTKLAATDVHMAYTASAADWMGVDKQVAAFRRVPSGTCDYCEAAAEGLYHTSDQMPIHENCECDLEPVFPPPKDGVAPMFLPDGSVTGTAYHLTTTDSAQAILADGVDMSKVGRSGFDTFGKGFYMGQAPPAEVGYGKGVVQTSFHFRNPAVIDLNAGQKYADVEAGHDGLIVKGYGLDGDQTIMVAYGDGTVQATPPLPGFHAKGAGQVSHAGDLDARLKTEGAVPAAPKEPPKQTNYLPPKET